MCVVEFTAFFDSNFFLLLWLSSNLRSNFDAPAAEHFNLLGDAVIHLYGVGGRTVKKLRLDDLGVVSALTPDVIILE